MAALKKWSIRIFISLAALYVILLIPDNKSKINFIKPAQPFSWNSDSVWNLLENSFLEARKENDTVTEQKIQSLKKEAGLLYQKLNTNTYPPADSIYKKITALYFSIAPYIANMQEYRNWFIDYYSRVRNAVKLQTQHWDMQDVQSRNTVYTVLYGMRAATEEVLLQSNMQFLPGIKVSNEHTAAPAATIFGIAVHSGDLLVSRGGAEASALISRGNDYAGNFSHVALIYVNDTTHRAYLIEAHIEKGVAIASIEQYEADKKLRFMVLRPRFNLPAIQKDSMLPHKAARYAYEEALKRHIPYDFKMNYTDSSEMFCSEVASYAYQKNNIQLWQTLSTISSAGVVNWLYSFGVENFTTQMPSDLEYDPQLTVIAEWRDPQTLIKDHIDNAVMDVMLSHADSLHAVPYNTWMLPAVRIVKAYCVCLNYFGKTGMIPEGMSATDALRNQYISAQHQALKKETEVLKDAFIKDKGYFPPYWQLTKLAEQAYATLKMQSH